MGIPRKWEWCLEKTMATPGNPLHYNPPRSAHQSTPSPLSQPRKRSQLPVDMSNVYTLMGSSQSVVRVVRGVVPVGAHIFWKIKYFLRKSLLTLADCEWRAAAPGLKPLRLPRVRPSTSAVFSSLWASSGIHGVCYLRVFDYVSVLSAQQGRLEAWICPGRP